MDNRDHTPVPFKDFNGLWARGDRDSTPLDHFQDCENVKFYGSNSFRTRDGIGISQDVAVPLSNVIRIYNYPTNEGNTLIVLTFDDDTGEGSIHHVVDSVTTFGPLLTIMGMTDFAFYPYGGRAYISPFGSFDVGGLNQERGLEGEFVYVYAGDGTPARKAAGSGMTGTMIIANGAAGHTDPGIHVFGFVSETISGYLSPPSILTQFTTSAGSSVSFGSIPTSGDPNVVRRHLVATIVIPPPFNGDLTGHQFFFVPDATIDNNTDTFLNNISFYDADLFDDASYLFDNFEEIPAGAVLTSYHDRMVVMATFDQISTGYVSFPGEPEAINQVDGVIEFPPDGYPITNGQELRDVFYVTKRAKTGSFTDNGDIPTTWPFFSVDNALGTCVHGVATVLDSGSASVDYLIICTYQGVTIFNGKYVTPELSWKIENYWTDLDRNEFRKIQIVNAPVQKEIYIVLPTRKLLAGNYGNGFDPKKIRWAPWSYQMGVNTVAIYQINEIILGTDLFEF